MAWRGVGQGGAGEWSRLRPFPHPHPAPRARRRARPSLGSLWRREAPSPLSRWRGGAAVAPLPARPPTVAGAGAGVWWRRRRPSRSPPPVPSVFPGRSLGSAGGAGPSPREVSASAGRHRHRCPPGRGRLGAYRHGRGRRKSVGLKSR